VRDDSLLCAVTRVAILLDYRCHQLGIDEDHMASIRAIKGKQSTSFEVRIRRKGHSRSRIFTSRTEAEAYGMRVESDMLEDRYVHSQPLASVTLADFLTKYSKEVTPGKKGRRQELGRIRQLLSHPLAERSILSLASSDFAALRVEMESDDYAPSTINKFLFLLSAIYKEAGEWGYGDLVNPISKIRKCYVDPAGCGRRLSSQEEHALIQALDQNMRDLVGLAIETAGRRSELVLLEWTQVNLEARTISFLQTKSGKPRIVPLSRRAGDILASRSRSGKRVFDMHVDTATFQVHRAWQCVREAACERAHHENKVGVDFNPKRCHGFNVKRGHAFVA
jgi:integrase